jgi:hypothetical protein
MPQHAGEYVEVRPQQLASLLLELLLELRLRDALLRLSMGGTSSATNRLNRSALSEGTLIPLTITGRLTLEPYSLSVV